MRRRTLWQFALAEPCSPTAPNHRPISASGLAVPYPSLLELRDLCHAPQRTADQGPAGGPGESEAGYSEADYSLAESLLVAAL
jgi:hypothetical protein